MIEAIRYGPEFKPWNVKLECRSDHISSKKITLGVFLKGTATRYRIGSQTKVSQPFDY